MIKSKGREKPLNHSKEEIISIIKESYEFAIKSITHFFELLDLDPKMFSHLFKIDIIIDYTKDVSYERELAHYHPNENKIHVCPEYVSDMLDFLKKYKRSAIAHNIANTLIHEIVHANRDIFINNGIHSLRIADSLCDDPDKYDFLCRKYSSLIKGTRKNEALLFRTSLKGNFILAYNNENNNFDLYSINDSILSSDNTLEDSEMIINSPILMKLYNAKKVKSFFQLEDFSVGNISDFNYDSTKQMKDLNLEEKSNAFDIINIQNNVEEILTEAISHIIMHSSNKDTIDLEETYDFFVNNKTEKDIEIGLFLFKEFGIDFLKWYIVSCYEEVYDNQLKKVLKDKYDTVMEELSYVYDLQFEGNIIEETDISDIKSNILSLKK